MIQSGIPMRLIIYTRFFFTIALFLVFSVTANAQLNVAGYNSAATLANALAGTGVTILNPTLTCAGAANGTFTTGAVSPINIANGIVLTTGLAIHDSIIAVGDTTWGVSNPASSIAGADWFANTDWGLPGDAQLSAIAGGEVTNDACVLEFDFKPAGDTIKFNYVFGSEEYDSYTCSDFNDVFAFLITGGAYTTATNLALVPGTNIPVCINSVNCGATGSWPLSTCTAVGPGSPFCAYYINNEATTAISNPYVVYNGLTTLLQVVAAVSPCDTYHLKLAIADGVDGAYDSGVFIEGGSLTSATTTGVTATGTSGLPYCIRGCAPGNFQFTTPVAQDTPIVVHYIVGGTAVSGYDYATIPDSVIIAPGTTSSILSFNTLTVPPAGPKVVSLQIEVQDPCHPGVYNPGPVAELTILDSFSFHIVTPDTAICAGQSVHLIAVGDSIFDSILHYTWQPSGTISNDTTLTPFATPLVTTTYTLTATTALALGCAPESHAVTIGVYAVPLLTVDSTLVNTCVGVPVQLAVYASPDTTSYTYSWTPPTGLSSTVISNPVVTPAVSGNTTYNVAVAVGALPACASATNITVHTEPNDFTLNNGDTTICLGQSVMVNINGSGAFAYSWSPVAGVSSSSSMDPTIVPVVATAPDSTFYTVTATYANCPAMMHSFSIKVDTPATPVVITDTLCLGMSQGYNVAVPGGADYSYLWTSSTGTTTYLTDTSIPNPISIPGITGLITYTVTISPPNVVGCANKDIANLFVLPNTINLTTPDTAICLGSNVQVIATGDALFNYQWLPTAGIAASNSIDPLITPDTSATYVVTASFHLCPDIHDTLRIDVQPRPSIYMGLNRAVCQGDTINIRSSVNPPWYTGYSYTWSPATNLNSTTGTNVIFTAGVTDTTELILTVNTPVSLTTDTTCRSTDSIQVITYPGNFENPLPDINVCPNQSVVVAPSGAGATFHWYPSIYVSDSLGTSPTISPITSLVYSVVATSIYGCQDTVGFTVTVQPAAIINIADSVTLYPGETYYVADETNCTSFSWFPSAGLSSSVIPDPVAAPGISTVYTVTGTTEMGCATTDTISVHVDLQSLLAMPNAFTPGNGANNEYKIIKRGLATLNYFRIFNRWGNVVFETTDIDKGWDGTYQGTPQPFGVYIYEVQAATSAGTIFEKQGNITLIR
jgi:gliding motility-associated-like protein